MEGVPEQPSPVETIFGSNELVIVNPMTSPPYNWICFLTIYSGEQIARYGSGFAINLPSMINYTAIVTSGHCVYLRDNDKSKNSYADKIIVKFPGEPDKTVQKSDLYASPEYIGQGNPDYDYGLILITGERCGGFGWSSICPTDNRLVTVCGYPVKDQLLKVYHRGTMWITGGAITKVEDGTVWYTNDTLPDMGGSPVYTWYGGYWTVVAVHSHENSGPQFSLRMISRFMKAMKTKVELKSVIFDNVYIRMDGCGSGSVNCQYTAYNEKERFYIHPLQMAPSLATDPPLTLVVIESAADENSFIYLDGRGANGVNPSGVGSVNCSHTAAPWEFFYLKPEDQQGVYSFINYTFTHCRIRVDGNGVTTYMPGGGGLVNAQWYENMTDPAQDYEKIQIVPAS